MSEDTYFGTTFTTKQIQALAIVGMGGLPHEELEKLKEVDLYDGPDDLFNTIMNLKLLGLVESRIVTLEHDPETEPHIVFRLTEEGGKLVMIISDNARREMQLRGEDT